MFKEENMTYCGPQQLIESMQLVRGHTITIANDIPEDDYDFRPAPGTRSIRETLLHLVLMTSLDERLHGDERLRSFQGFDFRAFFAALPTQENSGLTKAAVLSALSEEGERWSRLVQRLPENVLPEPVQTPRGAKTRFEMLLGTKEHEMHHRGQLMLIERLLGIVPHLTRNRQRVTAETQNSN
jgi:uncharacterized damage-inducible protein DinB